ncbi:MAG: ThiF family adenylyltransferase [Candidatus Eremiobacterota bacterium]
MADYLLHESLQRTPEAMERLRQASVTVLGAGALGANLAETLARTGLGTLKVIDRDRVEEHNLSTQPYYKGDVGSFKARILAASLYRAVGAKVEGVTRELEAGNISKLLEGSRLVVDCFDNSASRRLVTDFCLERGLPCLHAGLAAGYAEVIWNEDYRVPSPTGEDDCNYPLARNLVQLAVAVAAEVLVNFLLTGERRAYTVTLRDLAVKPYDFCD